MTAAKEAITTNPTPADFVDIKTVPVEQEAACRAATNLQFLASDGIFTEVTKDKITARVLGTLTEVIKFNLKVNPANRIDPDLKPPGCNKDGVLYLAANSVNVLSVADPIYTRNGAGKVTNVTVFFTRTNKTQPATLGLRVKFEEGVVLNTDFNPKRKSGTVSFP